MTQPVTLVCKWSQNPLTVRAYFLFLCPRPKCTTTDCQHRLHTCYPPVFQPPMPHLCQEYTNQCDDWLFHNNRTISTHHLHLIRVILSVSFALSRSLSSSLPLPLVCSLPLSLPLTFSLLHTDGIPSSSPTTITERVKHTFRFFSCLWHVLCLQEISYTFTWMLLSMLNGLRTDCLTMT